MNRIKSLLFAILTILVVGLFVACSDDVIASRDNGNAYTQTLESNGAFLYNGHKYNTLDDALQAIATGKVSNVDKIIKVLKNVKDGSANVPVVDGVDVVLDLNGKTLSLLSPKGIVVKGNLEVTGNGKLTHEDKSEEAAVFSVEGGSLDVENTTLSVEGRNAVKASAGTVNLGNNTTVDGNIEATGTSRVNLRSGSKFVANGSVTIGNGATFDVATTSNPTVALKLNGGTLTVDKTMALNEDSVLTSGSIVISEGSIDNHITKPESVVIPSTVNISTGLFSITRSGETTYYKSLADAIEEYESSSLVITQVFASTAGATINAAACHSDVTTVKIVTNNSIGAITVAAGYTLEVSGNGTVASVNLASDTTTTPASPVYGKLKVDGTSSAKPTISTVTGSGIVESQNAVFSGSVTCTTLTDGSNTGGSSTVYAEGSTFKGAVTVTGNIQLYDSTLSPDLSSDNDNFVYSEGSITMGGVKFNNVHVGVCAAKGGSVNMINSTGTAHKIVATKDVSSTPGTITIDNSAMTSGTFIVTNEVAARVGEYSSAQYNNVTIRGYEATVPAVSVDYIDAAAIIISHATVTNSEQGESGARARSGSFVSDNCVFNSVVEVYGSGNNLTDGDKTTGKNGSTFKNGISVGNGSASFYSSTFDPSANDAQHTSFSASTVTIEGAVFSTVPAGETNEGQSTGNLYNLRASAVFDSSSNAISISSSTGYIGTISATGNGNIKLRNVTGTVGAISTENGTVLPSATTCGLITIDNVTDGASVTGALTTGALIARTWTSGDTGNRSYGVYGDVVIKGNSETSSNASRIVTAASITANEVTASYATVTGSTGANSYTVNTTDYHPGVIVSDNSTFGGTVTASKLTDGNSSTSKTGSTFNSHVTITAFESSSGDGSATLYKSVLEPTINNYPTFSAKTVTANTVNFKNGEVDSQYDGYNGNYRFEISAAGKIKLTSCYGSIGEIKSTGDAVEINNTGAVKDLFIKHRQTGVSAYTNAISAYNGTSTYYDVGVAAPTNGTNKVEIKGLVTGKDITMIAGGSSYKDETLVVYGIGNHEFYSSESTNIYGGKYGVTESVLFSGDDTNSINIHKGSFYVGSYDACLQSVAENLHSDYDYDVNIYISGNITLETPLVVGLKKGGYNISPDKNVNFISSSDSSTFSIIVPHDSNGYTKPVVLAGGRIVFDNITVRNADTSSGGTFDSSIRDDGKNNHWWKNNGLHVSPSGALETPKKEFTSNSEIPSTYWN